MKKRLLVFCMCVVMLFVVGCSNSAAPVQQSPDSGEDVEANDFDDWPNRAIMLTIPCSPGGDTDFNIRTLGKYLEEELGVPVVPSNVIGAAGLTGYRHVRESEPNGYTLLSDHSAFVLAKVIGQHDYDFEKDFELIGIYTTVPGHVVCVSGESGITNMKELMEAAEEAPNTLRMATNIGATTQVNANLMQEAGLKVIKVDVGGTPEQTVALLGGHVDIISGPYASYKQYVESGDMNVIGSFEKERNPMIPDVPTFVEQGYESIVYDPPFSHFWLGVPKETPKVIVEKLRDACENVSRNKDYAEELTRFYQVPNWIRGDEAKEVFDKVEEICKEYLLE
jgi:tripartite-type tricarboxylate transporter receptor subunit TctC